MGLRYAPLTLLVLAAVVAAASASVVRRSIDLSTDMGRPSDWRLPDGLTPSHYTLTLQPFLEEARFQGRVRINVTCDTATRAVHLHAHEALHIAHDGVRVWRLAPAASTAATHSSEEDVDGDADPDAGRELLPVASTKKDTFHQQYVIFLANNLTEGSNYEVELTFSGPLTQGRGEGFFTNSYEDHRTKGRRPYAATQLRSGARRLFPCFDAPHYKASFAVSVVRPARMGALSNMPLRATEKMQGEPGWEVDHFQTTPLMSTFSLAVVVSDLGYITPLNPLTTEGGPQLRVFGRAHFLGRVQAAADAAPAALAFLQEYLGVAFPLPQIDLVALPHFGSPHPADAWGLVLFREEDLVGPGATAQLTTELAYQWLGHLATPAPRHAELQLNKALVNFLTAARLQGTSPEFSPGNLATRDHSLYYEYSKKHPYAIVKSKKETIRLMKTQWVIRMVNNSVSERSFQGGLQHFMQERQFSVWEEAELLGAVGERAWHDGTLPRDVRLADAVASWTTRDRFPAVSVTRNYNDATAEIEQHVFLRDRPRAGGDDGPLWFVPLPMLTQGDLELSSVTTAGWLTRYSRPLTLRGISAGPKEFIIINPNEIGMYMVNYDSTNWALLSAYLQRAGADSALPAVDVGTRAKLLHDAWNLALGGELPATTALDMTLFLPREEEFAVWDTFFTMVDHVGRHVAGSPAGDKFQAYVCQLVEPLHASLSARAAAEAEGEGETAEGVATAVAAAEGGEPLTAGAALPPLPATQQHKEKERDRAADPAATLRALAKYAMCTAGCAPCREQATIAFAKWMAMDDPEEGNPVADVFLCPALAWGSDAEWEFALERVINFPAEREPAERAMLIAKVAGCARDEQRLLRLLNVSLLEPESNFTTADVRQMLNALAGNAFGHRALFHFVSDNWDAVREWCSQEPGMWEFFTSRALSNFKTQEGLDLVSELYVSRMGQWGSAEGVVEEALKAIKEEAEWGSENLPEMERWLDGRLSSA